MNLSYILLAKKNITYKYNPIFSMKMNEKMKIFFLYIDDDVVYSL
jgi:hypothetical protein